MGVIVFFITACNQKNTNRNSKMEKAKIVEVIKGKPKKGMHLEDAKSAIISLNVFFEKQTGFIARKTALAADGVFMDIVYWTDMNSARIASKNAIESDILVPISNTMDEETMTIQYYEVFNDLKK